MGSNPAGLMNEKKKLIILIIINNNIMLTVLAVNFKNSATPFAEALVELHHEIMFYLIVIVSVVIYILLSAINISRVREFHFFSSFFSISAFSKSLFVNASLSWFFERV